MHQAPPGIRCNNVYRRDLRVVGVIAPFLYGVLGRVACLLNLPPQLPLMMSLSHYVMKYGVLQDYYDNRNTILVFTQSSILLHFHIIFLSFFKH